jgi:hypothetical protein
VLLHGRVASSLWSCSWVVKGSEIGDCRGLVSPLGAPNRSGVSRQARPEEVQGAGAELAHCQRTANGASLTMLLLGRLSRLEHLSE